MQLWVLLAAAAARDGGALRQEVLDLCAETRDVVVAEGHVAAVREHDRFAQFCGDHLQAPNATQQAHEALEKACGAEAVAWDKHERLRSEEVDMLNTVLTLLGSHALAPALVQASALDASEVALSPVNKSAAEQQRICAADLAKMNTLRSALDRKVNTTSNATAALKDALDSRSEALGGVRKGARANFLRTKDWEAGYKEQEAGLASQGEAEQGASRAMHLAIDMLTNFYAQRHASPADDVEAMGADQALEDFRTLWPGAPAAAAPYAFHKEMAGEVLAVLRTWSSLLEAEVHDTRVVEDATRGEARRVRGYRTTRAHNAREQIAKLKLDLKDDDQALVALRERLHTEEGELASVDEKLTLLKSLCDRLVETTRKLGSLNAKLNATAEP